MKQIWWRMVVGADIADRSIVLDAKPVIIDFFSRWWRRQQSERTTTSNNDEIEQRWVMLEDLCCRRGNERRKRDERVGEGTSNNGGFLGSVHRKGRKKEARMSVGESESIAKMEVEAYK